MWMLDVGDLLPKCCPHVDMLISEIGPKCCPHVDMLISWKRRLASRPDTFKIGDWWRANGDKVPHFKFVLRAVLANSPNSIPPERVFSILNDTFDDDQRRALADYMYIELTLQLQFNERSRKNESSSS